MKTNAFIVLLFFLTSSRLLAQFVVLDVANLAQSVTSYAALVSQLAKQAEQISHQVQQIKQMDDQLGRLGKMADFKNLIGFPEYRVSLTVPTKVKTWAQTLLAIDGIGLFGDTRGGIFTAVAREFLNFDGGSIAREPSLYKAAHEIAAKVDNFIEVQADVYVRREVLKKAIATTSEALQAAETEAEEQKLEALLEAQFQQLAVLDSEVTLSAAEIQVKAVEAAAMKAAQVQADAEAREKLMQQEAKKVGATFKPLYSSFLYYVREQPFGP